MGLVCYFSASCFAIVQMFKVFLLLFFVIPRKDSFITKLGERSLYAYLLHLLVQRTLRAATRTQSCHCNEGGGWLVFIAYLFTINAALSSSWTAAVFGIILQPSWLERLVDAMFVLMNDLISSFSSIEGTSSEEEMDAPLRAVSDSDEHGLLGVKSSVE